jgi:drug/metabolite transporter (DMT)-like permease
LSTPATAEAEAPAAPARRRSPPGRAAAALREAPYLDGLDRRYLDELRSARERGEAGRYLASLGAANKLNELRSRETATTEHYLDGLDRSKWTATAFSRELERRRQEKLTVAKKPSMVTLVEDAPPVIVPAVEIYASDLPVDEIIDLVTMTDAVADAVGEVLEEAALSIPEEEESSLAWKGAMLFVTVAWATNFAVTAYACTLIGESTSLGASEAAAVFVVLRFAAAALSTLPWLVASSSKEAAIAGAKVGALYAVGYGAQAAALAHGFPAANAAFVCSLQCVAVALLAKGQTPPRTIVGLVLAISGVACLELLGANGGSFDPLGLALALGQPLAFGASYVELERATRDHPDDALAMTALQCLAIFGAGVGALAAMEGFDGAMADVLATVQHLDAPLAASVAWTGVISTSFTIWLCTEAFKHLPSVDASLILTSEPLWAALVAAALLGERFSAGDALGGLLIVLAVAVNDELIRVPGRMCLAPHCVVDEED